MNSFQWSILGCYAGLLVFLTALLVLSEFVGPSVRSALLPVTANGLEFVLGAAVGAITTLMASAKFNASATESE